MDTPTLIVIVGIFLTNLGLILTAWIKVKTDITAINVFLKGLEIRVTDMEEVHSKTTDKLDSKVDRFIEVNNTQHGIISNKMDDLKDSLNDFKVDIIKQLK